jgi:hypothetical protein
MNDEEGEEPSAAMVGWQEIAADLRQTLAQFAREAGKMNMDDVRTLTQACREAQWLEQAAADYDHEIALNKARIVFSD